MRKIATVNDLYNTLSYNIWKSGMELINELKKDYNTILIYPYRYNYLHKWEEEGWVDSRERILSKEILKVRGNFPLREYKLTEKGIKKNVELGNASLDGLVLEPI